MKGISPIVAVVLLLAMTVIAGVGIYFWALSLSSKQATPEAPTSIVVNPVGKGKLLIANLGPKGVNLSNLHSNNGSLSCPPKVLKPGDQEVCEVNASEAVLTIWGNGVGGVTVQLPPSSGENSSQNVNCNGTMCGGTCYTEEGKCCDSIWYSGSYRCCNNSDCPSGVCNTTSHYCTVVCYPDADDDSYTSNVGDTFEGSCPEHWTNQSSDPYDCDDNDASVHPGASEVYDGKDDNCDGSCASGECGGSCGGCLGGYSCVGYQCTCTGTICSGICHTDSGVCCSGTWYSGGGCCSDSNCGSGKGCNPSTHRCEPIAVCYRDSDGDGYGDPNSAQNAYGSCPSGYATDHSDCDDNDASVHPGASEVYDGKDDNCDGSCASGECGGSCGSCPSGYGCENYKCVQKIGWMEIVSYPLVNGFSESSISAYDITPATDGSSYFFVGTKSDSSPYPPVLFGKITKDGQLSWTKRYQITTDFVVKLLSDGGNYIVLIPRGNITSSETPTPYLMKLDSNGNIVALKKYSNNDRLISITKTSDGKYLLVGTDEGQIAVALINPDLTVYKETKYGGYSEGIGGIQTSDGGYLISGDIYPSGYSNSDTLLLKLDSNLNVQWARRYRINASRSRGWVPIQTDDGGYLILGDIHSSVGGGYILKVDSAGNTQWVKILTAEVNTIPYDAIKTGEDRLIEVIGSHVIAINTSTGSVTWAKEYNTTKSITPSYSWENSDIDSIISTNEDNESILMMVGSVVDVNQETRIGTTEGGIFIKTRSNGEILDCDRVKDVTSEVNSISVSVSTSSVSMSSTQVYPTVTSKATSVSSESLDTTCLCSPSGCQAQ